MKASSSIIDTAVVTLTCTNYQIKAEVLETLTKWEQVYPEICLVMPSAESLEITVHITRKGVAEYLQEIFSMDWRRDQLDIKSERRKIKPVLSFAGFVLPLDAINWQTAVCN